MCAPIARPVAEQAFQLTQRLAALPIGIGVDQVVEAFGFGEIELAVLERPARELARLRRAYIFKTRERREERCEHRAPTVDVKFSDILPGRAGRRRKPEHDGIIDRLFGGIAHQRARRPPRRRHLARKRGEHGPGLRSRYPHQGNRARRSAG